ncbi:alpha/beta-hydrolase [Jaminaea rosea]|uniref:Alpha/beta-hydrolase n=1 Tax=Jaminaea rosea TaxID=1569628 RepID=A0A316URP6_9BASI|nr:alpha/beta-hydrolase [Jaminaea rosea]PWN25805.1 alpha/beta-hydrolase [Jaminaea rosea]
MPSYLPTLSTLFRLFSLLSVLTISTLGTLLYTYQGKLIYPSNLPPGSREDRTRPDAYQLPFEEELLPTPDGEQLHAWFISRPNKRSRVVVMMFQANAGNIAHRLPIAAMLFKKIGCDVVMFSYRGYGLSSGTASEKGIQIDAQVVLDWVRKRNAATQAKLVLYGQSLGGAVAIATAARNASSTGIAALVLENTFTSIPALIPTVLPPARFFSFLCREVWQSDQTLARVDPKIKVLFLSGGQDELVPPSQMRELWEVATKRSQAGREWLLFPKGTHNDTCMARGYWPALASFLHRHLGHETDLSREAIAGGFNEKTMSGPGANPGGVPATRGEKEALQEMMESGDEEGEYGDDWASSTASASGGAAAGVRKRGGAGGAGPADVVDEEMETIETEGVRNARRGDGGKL